MRLTFDDKNGADWLWRMTRRLISPGRTSRKTVLLGKVAVIDDRTAQCRIFLLRTSTRGYRLFAPMTLPLSISSGRLNRIIPVGRRAVGVSGVCGTVM